VPIEPISADTRKGMAAFELGEYEDALKWFEKVIAKKPKSALGLRDCGHAAFHLQKGPVALDYYARALKIQPRLLDAHLNVGLLHAQRGHVNEALAEFKEVLQGLHPLVPGAFYLGLLHTVETLETQVRLEIGLLLKQRGDLEQSIEQFQAILKKVPQHLLALGNLGDCQLALEHWADAAQTYHKALSVIPEGPERDNLQNDMGVAFFRGGETEKAIEQFKGVLKRDPDNVNAVYNLGQVYFHEGLTGRVKRDYEELAKEKGGAAILFALSKSIADVAEAQGTENSADNLLIGQSAPMRAMRDLIRRAAASDATVLILGENGSGKELVARSIHQQSTRHDQPFLAVACSALSETLLESELFGHEKGSFTGAIARKIGRFEAANHGTLFLDEIGEISPALQVKLLRVLQEREFERVGGTETLHVDVRILAATNRDLKKEVAEGRFREDLYYRLNVILIEAPPLRERSDDIPMLLEHFLKKLRKKSSTRFEGATSEALKRLAAYRWPGNVREMENLVERVVTLFDDTRIRPEYLPSEVLGEKPRLGNPLPRTGDLSEDAWGKVGRLDDLEREAIRRALIETRFNKKKAAEKLGISRPTLYEKIRRYDLDDLKV
jgi:transcriptional regulator with PAS, ATPase and Fis domain